MPEYTSNYNLVKQLPTEYYDRKIDNDNLDTIDSQLKTNSNSLGTHLENPDPHPQYALDDDLNNLAGAGRTNETVKKNADDIAALSQAHATHLAETMPHKFTDGTKTYRWGLAVIDDVVNMVYEEVV